MQLSTAEVNSLKRIDQDGLLNVSDKHLDVAETLISDVAEALASGERIEIYHEPVNTPLFVISGSIALQTQ